MNVSLVNLNNLSENELNEFIFKFLSLSKSDVDEDNKEELYKLIIEKLFEINQSHKRKYSFSNSFKQINNRLKKNSIIEGLFDLITFFESIEEYETCALIKKIKDNLLMDL
ncbi:MAG: hypothetical protein CMP68_04890 [Flavobacteriales bacterium]|nr:hypothetical protein [Flavobacteriales bacterium]|tara:strand:+ start:9727 stop:10059 length:333 start_codon:yes stop_codon:yes gene_type:complete